MSRTTAAARIRAQRSDDRLVNDLTHLLTGSCLWFADGVCWVRHPTSGRWVNSPSQRDLMIMDQAMALWRAGLIEQTVMFRNTGMYPSRNSLLLVRLRDYQNLLGVPQPVDFPGAETPAAEDLPPV